MMKLGPIPLALPVGTSRGKRKVSRARICPVAPGEQI